MNSNMVIRHYITTVRLIIRRLNLTYVYIDIYYLTNLMADVTVLLMFCMIINIRINIVRIILSAMIGSVYSVLSIIYQVHPLIIQLFGVITAGIMIGLVINNSRVRIADYIRYILLIYLISFATGGVTYYIVSDNNILFHLIIMLIMPGVVFVVSGPRGLDRFRYMNTTCCNVTIISGSRKYSGIGYYDSGNGMYEPISGSMVIIGNVNNLSSFLTEGEMNYIRLFPELPGEWDGRTYIRGIPYSALGTTKGMLPGIRLDEVEIIRNKVITKYNNCYIGISTGELSLRDEYDFILHRDMI